MILPKKNIMDIAISSTIPATYRVELFNAIADRTIQANPKLDAINAAFLSTNVPANTLEGMVKIAAQGNGNGCISWLAAFGLSSIIHLSNNGLQSCTISLNSEVFTYRQMIEFLKSSSIKVGKVKITSADVSQVKNSWKFITKKYDKTETSEDIILENLLQPTQVQSGILEFELNRVIDKYTSIQMNINPLNIGVKISMEFELIKD